MNFPETFIERVRQDPFLGEGLLTALDEQSPVSVRVNPFKIKPGLPWKGPVTWCEHGYYLEKRPAYITDPLFHAGCYYPQEAGSMLLDTLVRQLELGENPVILDLCAAPGGKSTLLQSFLDGRGYLVSNEVIGSRARVLRENSVKWGMHNVIVTNNDPADFQRLPHWFDLIVIDAPCSGEGMFRKDPLARGEWNADSPEFCAARQRRIVMDIWESLKPGGYLIYSTCTFNSSENEDNVRRFIEETDAELITPSVPETIISGRSGIGHYCIPGKTESEGFYAAVLRKTDGQEQAGKLRNDGALVPVSTPGELENWYRPCDTICVQRNDSFYAFPEQFADEFMHVRPLLHVLKMGTHLADSAKKGMIPSEEILLNAVLRRIEASAEPEETEVLRYLRGETFPLDGPSGFRAVTYQNEPLGWIKHLGNRFNNLYPKEWRIRKQLG